MPCSTFETTAINLPTLKEIAASQGTTFRQGDILFVRTGWTKSYDLLSADQCLEIANKSNPPAIGVESSEETLRWIWDEGFAAVAGDGPSFEAWPCQDERFWMHEWLLAGWGCPIGELFDLEQLSEECQRRKRWTYFFSSVPLKVSNRTWIASSEELLTGLRVGPRRGCKSTQWSRHFVIR